MKELIKEYIARSFQKNELFTSVNISNNIKRDGVWVRNRDVAKELRNTYLPVMYQKTTIDVNNGQNKATLYHPLGTPADDYTDNNIEAISYKEWQIKNLENKSDETRETDTEPFKLLSIRDRVFKQIEKIGLTNIDEDTLIEGNMNMSQNIDLIRSIEKEFDLDFNKEFRNKPEPDIIKFGGLVDLVTDILKEKK